MRVILELRCLGMNCSRRILNSTAPKSDVLHRHYVGLDVAGAMVKIQEALLWLLVIPLDNLTPPPPGKYAVCRVQNLGACFLTGNKTFSSTVDQVFTNNSTKRHLCAAPGRCRNMVIHLFKNLVGNKHSANLTPPTCWVSAPDQHRVRLQLH